MPYYWKRGLIAGLVVGITLHILLQQLAIRRPAQPLGNIPMTASETETAPRPRTPLGPLMGVTIFVLCCVMPGPTGGRVGR